MISFKYLFNTDVSQIVEELSQAEELWDEHTYRTEGYISPHRYTSDIFVRFNPVDNYKDDFSLFNVPHLSAWYEGAELLPSVKKLALELMAQLGGEILGGVLMTRLPPGKEIYNHIDGGFHAGFYDKFLVNIKCNQDQAFVFDEGNLINAVGDVSWFRNDVNHAVTNNSDEERISLIVCIKTEKEFQ